MNLEYTMFQTIDDTLQHITLATVNWKLRQSLLDGMGQSLDTIAVIDDQVDDAISDELEEE